MPGQNIIGSCEGGYQELEDGIRSCVSGFLNSSINTSLLTVAVTWSRTGGADPSDVNATLNAVFTRETDPLVIQQVINGDIPVPSDKFILTQCGCCNQDILSIFLPESISNLNPGAYFCDLDLPDPKDVIVFFGISLSYNFLTQRIIVSLDGSAGVIAAFSNCILANCNNFTSGDVAVDLVDFIGTTFQIVRDEDVCFNVQATILVEATFT
jgi:hypothetical protein